MSKIALITGASRGIGAAIARELAKAGYDLYITCHASVEQLQILASELEKEYSIAVHPVSCDMSDPDQVEALFSQISDLDVLINNAGISYVGLLTDMSIGQWQNVINTNLSSMFYTSRLAVPMMLQKHCGKIINISSVWGNCGASTEVAYSASKGGVNSFTKALAKELAPSGIQVNALALGIIDTDMNACFSEEDIASLTEEIPADRIGTPEEAAQMVSAMLSMPAYTTGQIFTMDGGWI